MKVLSGGLMKTLFSSSYKKNKPLHQLLTEHGGGTAALLEEGAAGGR